MPRWVLLASPVGEPARDRLHTAVNVLDGAPDVLEAQDLRRVDTVVCRSGVNLDRGVLSQLSSLRRVVRAGSGTDNIDLAWLEAHDIDLRRLPGANAEAVAELAVASLILLARRVPLAHAATLAGEWRKPALIGDTASHLRAVVWGDGPVGRACADRLATIVAEVRFAAHPSRPSREPSISVDAAQQESDVHVLCLPLRADTGGMFGQAFLRAIRDRRPYVLNVARLGLMDLDAMLDAVVDGSIRGLLVDPIDQDDLGWLTPRTQGMPPANLLLSQHLGAQRADIRATIDAWVVDQVLEPLT